MIGPRRALKMRKISVILVFLLVASIVGAWWYWYRAPSNQVKDISNSLGEETVEDVRLAYQTPYKNVRPDVRYLGSERCADCHAEIAVEYRKHPMGRSMEPIGANHSLYESLVRGGKKTFVSQGFHYEVEARNGNLIHREVFRNEQGDSLTTREVAVAHAIGSGTQGKSFFYEADGFLFQSPISWYAKGERWDLSPGFDKISHHFDRPVTPECLYCHADPVAPIPGTSNRYEPPVIRGHAIGCERCHGPGDLHARERAEQTDVAKPDHSIVNPKHLSPLLRDAVCEQCHLLGDIHVIRKGQKLEHYRPGLPLHHFVSVFSRIPELLDSHLAVGHVGQMRMSRCFQKSDGAMGCIACHDPHRRPTESERIAYFRHRCLACHTEKTPCALPMAERSTKNDSCIACHMPRRDTADVAHTTHTDHRVMRIPTEGAAAKKAVLKANELPIHYVNQHLPEIPPGVLTRDLGMALIRVGKQHRMPNVVSFGLARLKPTIDEKSSDTASLEAMASALHSLKRFDEAEIWFDRLLNRAPNYEDGISLGVSLMQALEKWEEAEKLAEQLVRLNPQLSLHHSQMAFHFARKNLWQDCLASAQKALELNPTSLQARKLQIFANLQLGNRDAAQTQFQVFRAFQPADEAVVRRWFDGNSIRE